MGKYIDIPTSDGFEIKGVLNWKEKSEKLIVFVHGFTGSMDAPHYMAAKEYFSSKGYDIFRFALYYNGENFRKLHTTTVSQHTEDIENVIAYFGDGYSDIILIGHSLGCSSIIGVSYFSTSIKKLIFWDPALNMKEDANNIFKKNNAYYISSEGKNIEVSKEMLQEFQTLDYVLKLEKLLFPINNVKIIYASQSTCVYDKSKTDKLGIDTSVIEGANHGFTQEGKYKELFEKTLEFIEK